MRKTQSSSESLAASVLIGVAYLICSSYGFVVIPGIVLSRHYHPGVHHQDACTTNYYHTTPEVEQPLLDEVEEIKQEIVKLEELGKQRDYREAQNIINSLVEAGKKPGLSSYYYLLESYSDSTIAERGEDILDILENEYSHKGAIAYNLALKICKNNSKGEMERAERIWNRALTSGLADEITYSTFAGILANQESSASAQRILDIARDNPSNINTQTWNNAMQALLKEGDTARAETILTLLEDCFHKNDGKRSPTVASYSILLDGWAKRNKVDKAQDVFDRMIKMYQVDGNEDSRPNAYPYVTLIHMYARQRGSSACARRAERTLFDMYRSYKAGETHLKPNTQLVTSCINAWQRSGARDCGERGEALLNWLLSLSKDDDDFAPSQYTFCCKSDAWFSFLCVRGISVSHPPLATKAAITAWARSRQIGKPVRARRILDIMLELQEKGELSFVPDAVCYTGVINACMS